MRICCLFLSLFTFLSVSAQRIDAKLVLKSEQWQDTSFYLAQYYNGSSIQIIDTFKLNRRGKCKVQLENAYVGQYVLVSPSRQMYDFILAEEKLKFNQSKDSFEVVKSDQSRWFREFMRLQTAVDQARIEVNKEENEQSIGKLLNLLNKRETWLQQHDEEMKGTEVHSIIQLICSPNDLGYYYIGENEPGPEFLRSIDISKEYLVFTEIFHKKIKFYLNKGVEQTAPAILSVLVPMIEKSKHSKAMFQYFINYWVPFYAQKPLPEYELVFKALVERYYVMEKVDWQPEYRTERILDEAKRLENLLLRTTPTKMRVFDTSGKAVSPMDSTENFKLFIFYNPNCAHCKELLPRYHAIYKDFRKDGLDAYSIYTENEATNWIKYVKETAFEWHNVADPESKGNLSSEFSVLETPTVLLLNRENEIVAKRFTPEELLIVLEQKL